MPSPADYPLLANSLLSAIERIAGRGWCPATGGNFSARVNDEWRLITQSGRDKHSIELNDLMLCDAQGQPLKPQGRPSDETPLHMALYALDPDIGCVLHTHSVAATVLSRHTPGPALKISGYEMQKALGGQTTHEAEIAISITDNSQDMPGLADHLKTSWSQSGLPAVPGLLVRGHGLYAWGSSVGQALRHIEGLEFLLACELSERQLGATP